MDKQQKMGEHVENIKFRLDTQLDFMLSTFSPVFVVVYPLEGLRFLYIFGDPGPRCAICVWSFSEGAFSDPGGFLRRTTTL